eukprot:8378102-Heterocapsa_arctica.AAC.1
MGSCLRDCQRVLSQPPEAKFCVFRFVAREQGQQPRPGAGVPSHAAHPEMDHLQHQLHGFCCQTVLEPNHRVACGQSLFHHSEGGVEADVIQLANVQEVGAQRLEATHPSTLSGLAVEGASLLRAFQIPGVRRVGGVHRLAKDCHKPAE